MMLKEPDLSRSGNRGTGNRGTRKPGDRRKETGGQTERSPGFYPDACAILSRPETLSSPPPPK